MKEIMISLATAGVLLGTAQPSLRKLRKIAKRHNDQPRHDPEPVRSQRQPIRSERERGGGTATQSGGEHRDGNRGERSGERGGERSGTTVRGGERKGMRVRERGERSSVNVRVRGGGDSNRYRRGHRINVYASGCRTIIVKKHYHGQTVIKRIRRCG